MKHTWRYEAETKTIRSVPENHWIATMDSWDGAEDHEANAKKIAATPELLEACQYVVNWHREHDSGEGELFGLDFVTTCIAAIWKATE